MINKKTTKKSDTELRTFSFESVNNTFYRNLFSIYFFYLIYIIFNETRVALLKTK